MALTTSETPGFLVKYTNLKWTKADITAVDSDAPLYSIEYHFRKPHLRFLRPGSAEPFATATFHLTTSRVDLQFSNGTAVDLKSKKLFSCDYVYTSPAFGNQPMTWRSKSHFKSYDFVLLDANQMPIAKMVSVAGLSVKKIGKVEFAEGFKGGDEAKEEVMIGAVSLAYHAMMQMMGAAGAA